MKRAKKKPNPQRRCIFCDGTPVTGEHLFSEWISKIVPRTGTRNIAVRSVSSFGAPRQVYETRRREGDLASKKIRAPCKRCNETWMSMLETASRPILTPLILGQRHSLAPEAQKVVGRWAILKAIVSEMDHEPSAVIPKASREQFHKTGELPPNHNVWIGHYAGQIWKGTHHYHRAIMGSKAASASKEPEGGVIDPKGPDFQTTTLVVGELYIHVFSGPPPVTYNLYPPASYMLAEILPGRSATIEWPLPIPIDDLHAMRIAYGR